eukprot:m.223158 g.223158  ORF g.223158 m.223158 type:complete len:191 (+) comp16190_c0_seq1:654-1226(+)
MATTISSSPPLAATAAAVATTVEEEKRKGHVHDDVNIEEQPMNLGSSSEDEQALAKISSDDHTPAKQEDPTPVPSSHPITLSNTISSSLCSSGAAAASVRKPRARHFNKTTCSMFVSNVHPNTTELLLAELFSYAGPVEDVFIPTDSATGQPKNFAFVEFFDENSVLYAQRLLDGLLLFQQAIRVRPALS